MPAATREAQDSGLGKIQPSTGLNHETKKNIMLIIIGFVHNDQIIDFVLYLGFCVSDERNQFIHNNYVKGYTVTCKKKKNDLKLML